MCVRGLVDVCVCVACIYVCVHAHVAYMCVREGCIFWVCMCVRASKPRRYNNNKKGGGGSSKKVNMALNIYRNQKVY